MTPDILFEDDSIIVCHKPSGLPVQSASLRAADLVSILKNHIAQNQVPNRAGQNKNRQPYLAVIHRLDQPVEGLLVFAKTPEAAANLNRQLTGSSFGKFYRAQLSAVPNPQEGRLTDYLVKDSRTNLSRICGKDTPGAKEARLSYRVTGIEDGRANVLIHLDTGRHHQIRVQMAHLGCPIVGDRKYGSPDGVGKLMLCACRLTFRHPSDGRPMEFDI